MLMPRKLRLISARSATATNTETCGIAVHVATRQLIWES
jgi:hypothetical protein